MLTGQYFDIRIWILADLSPPTVDHFLILQPTMGGEPIWDLVQTSAWAIKSLTKTREKIEKSLRQTFSYVLDERNFRKFIKKSSTKLSKKAGWAAVFNYADNEQPSFAL